MVFRNSSDQSIVSTLADGSICTAELSVSSEINSTPHTIDPSNLSSTTISLPNGLHASSSGGDHWLARPGSQVSPLNTSLIVSSIDIKNFVPTGASNRYLAEVQVSFSGGFRSIRPLAIKTFIVTDAATNQIVSCRGASGPTIDRTDCTMFHYSTSGGHGYCPDSYVMVGANSRGLGSGVNGSWDQFYCCRLK